MGQIDTEKKLELIRSIRMNQQNNRTLLGRREQILYGTSQPLVSRGELYGLESAAISDAIPPTAGVLQSPLRSFKIRLLIAVILFGAFVAWDRTGSQFMGFTSQQVSDAITSGGQEVFDYLAGWFNMGNNE